MPIANVNLMGPNPGQPFDIQTQQAQLARAQAIAQALIAQGLTPESPIIHTGGGNPFARDVANWAGPLSKALLTAAGTHRQGQLNDQEQGLAQDYNSRVKSGIEDYLTTSSDHMGEAAGPPVPGEGPPEMAMAGDPVKALANAMGSGLSPVQDLAKALLAAQVNIAGKSMTTPDNIAHLVSAGVDPASVPGATTAGRGPLGMNIPMLDYKKLFMQSKFVEPRGGVVAEANPGATQPPAGPSRINPPQVMTPVGPVVSADDPNNPIPGLPTQKGVTGAVEVPKGAEHAPSILAAREQIKASQEEIGERLPALIAAKKAAPQLVQIAEIVHRANMGQLGEAKNLMKAYATALGLTNDEIGSVNSTQTIQALLMPRAAQAAKEVNSTRATQFEFMKGLESVGAGKNIDPRHTIDMVGKALADAMSDSAVFHNEVLPRAKAAGVPGVEKYYTELGFEIPKGLPIHLEPGPNHNTFVNKGITEPRGMKEASGTFGGVPDSLYEKYGIKKE